MERGRREKRGLGALPPILGTLKAGPRSSRSFTHHLIHPVTPLLVKSPSWARCGHWTHKTKRTCIFPYGAHSPEAKILPYMEGHDVLQCAKVIHSFTDH